MALTEPRAYAALDADVIRRDFPLLKVQVKGRPIVYLDSASSSQKPQAVLDTLDWYYRHINANVHRGVYAIAEVRTARPDLGILLITHYQRILDHLTPDAVHVLLDGRIVANGGPELARRMEAEGFEAFKDEVAA